MSYFGKVQIGSVAIRQKNVHIIPKDDFDQN